MKPEIHAPPRPEQVLSGWKDIANYLHRDVRTVQRWEESRALPVHRLPGHGKNAIYALKSELDCWLADAPPQREKVGLVPLPAPPRRQRMYAICAGIAAVAALAFSVRMLVKP